MLKYFATTLPLLALLLLPACATLPDSGLANHKPLATPVAFANPSQGYGDSLGSVMFSEQQVAVVLTQRD